ncbi:hypothetical protein DW089_06395 [Acidaminococcus sp. AM05-11]|jgi:hypothetical protein|nr:hypothetical protein DW089_06395 [Acidaminococcus sp. AM05-11]
MFMQKKRCLAGLAGLLCCLSLAACGSVASTGTGSSTAQETKTAATEKTASASASQKTMPIRLTVNGKQVKAHFNDSAPAQELLGQLPKTVTLNPSDNDFCGDTLDLSYKASDVQSGYKNGDLAYWPPAKNFVIFVKDEEKSASIGNLVILGHVDEPQAVLNALQGTLKVEIAKAQ